MQQDQLAAAAATAELPPGGSSGEAPPKQVALAMDRLGCAGRVIADIRLGADRLLEALLATDDPHQVEKSLHLIVKEEASMRQHLQDLRTLGRQLEDSGVLNVSLRSRGNSWGLHMPLVCPDGAVVAYAWKRQLAGQAGASAVDRTRLALKAFTDQKRRFFPHLKDEPTSQMSGSDFGVSKRHCGIRGLATSDGDMLLSDIIINLEKGSPNMRIFTYQRLDWLKRASSLSSSADDNSMGPSKEQSFPNSSKPRLGSLGSLGSTAVDQGAVVELLAPSVFRAIVSLHPAGCIYPSSVAFFSPDEGGNYVHARGFSVYHVFRHITEHADKALHYFLSAKPDTPLSHLLQWICSYQTLFTKACSKCGRLLTMDKPLALLLPPVQRPYRLSSTINNPSAELTPSAVNHSSELNIAYHIGCSDEV